MLGGVLRKGLQPALKLARSIAGTTGLPGIDDRLGVINGRLDELSRQVELLEIQRQTPPNCPTCARHEIFRQVGQNVLRNGSSTPVMECPHCGHQFIYPVPSSDELLSWYQGMEYHVEDRAYQGIHSLELNEQWSAYISSRMTPLREEVLERFGLSDRLKIGEFGCGEGALLKHLALMGHSVIGFEAGAEIALHGSREYGIDIEPGDFELSETNGRDLDVIMSFHTLEHVRDPMSVVSHAAAMLHSGGCILIEVPCDDVEMASIDHLQFFSERSLRYVLKNHFNRLQIRPNSYMRGGTTAAGSLFISGQRKPDLSRL